MWPFKRKSREQALVEFAGFHVLCDVQRDADDRPFVMICRTAIRLDDPGVIEERNVIWIKRRADEPPAETNEAQCNGNCFLVGGPLGCRARCGLSSHD